MSSARRAAFLALIAAEADGAHIHDVLEVSGLSEPDRGLALELALGAERMHLLLDLVVGTLVARTLPARPKLRCTLRLGAYQLLFATRIPAHAAVHETVALLAPTDSQRGFVNAVLRRLARAVQTRPSDPRQSRRELPLPEAATGEPRTLVLDADALPDAELDPVGHCAAVHGLPAFLVQRWAAQHGFEAAQQIATASSAKPGITLRVKKTLPAAALREQLAAEDVLTETTRHPQLLRWIGGRAPFGSTAFARGEFVVQDSTAFAAVEALDARPGETIVDLCAAPGTKATWLAECVGAGGAVHAYDRDPARRARVRQNAERLRLPNLIVLDELGKAPRADRVLVDVPCSNTGVLARRVEVRRHVSEAAIARLAELQRDLLRQALGLTKPRGFVLYSTCSLEREENQAVVASTGLAPLAERLTLPEAGHCDGGYFALLQAGP